MTKYTVFEELKGPYGEGDRTAEVYRPVATVEADSAKQAIEAVSEDRDLGGTYGATPSRSWHVHTAKKKPAKFTVS